jgi:DNA-binding MarR family transcriptional regulator
MKSEEINEFRRVLRRFEREINIHLRDKGCCSGVTMSQCHVLLSIYEQKVTTTVDLSKELAIDKSNLSRIIESLVKLEYVERIASKEDRRYSKIKVTPKGKSKSNEINRSANAHYRKVFENIPEWKHKEIVENLTMLSLAFNAEENILLKNEDQENTCCG